MPQPYDYELAERLVEAGERIQARLENVDPEGNELDHALASLETARRACVTLEQRLKAERLQRGEASRLKEVGP